MARMSTSPQAAAAANPLRHGRSPSALALAGLLALAVAMGVGRFAFTPMLPLMMRDGLLDAAGGAELAAANYAGYLLGALTAAPLARRWPGSPRSLVLASLLATALLTAAMAASASPLVWLGLRALAGLVSAWALVATTGWVLSALAQAGRSSEGGWVFAGVGSGICAAGLLVWAGAGGATAPGLWLALAVLAAAMGGAVAVLLRPGPTTPVAASRAVPATGAAPGRPDTAAPGRPHPGLTTPAERHWPLVLCYGCFGFGYILPATFLPVMARSLLDDPRWFGLAWPAFGLAAAVCTLASGRWAAHWPRQRLWALCQAAMALGVVLPVLSHGGPAIAAAALLVGGSFMVATMAAMQLARTQAPQQPTALLGRMTAAFALGQIAGPLAVRALAGHPGWDAVALTSLLAAAGLAASALWLWHLQPAPATPA